MGESRRIQRSGLGRCRAFLGNRRIAGGKNGTQGCRREHRRRPRDRGSHDLRAAVFIAALPGDLNQQRGDRSGLAMPDDQRDVIDFPEQGVLFWDAVEPVEIIQTHVSLVLLAGDCAYKLKRAIKFPPPDLSTVEQRWAACEAELAL